MGRGGGQPHTCPDLVHSPSRTQVSCKPVAEESDGLVSSDLHASVSEFRPNRTSDGCFDEERGTIIRYR